jgi:tellurite methyltransferase
LKEDRIRWNKRYADKPYAGEPSDIVKRFYKQALAGGRALDIAAGNGRNALFLAQNNFKVDAVDIADVGLKHLSGIHQDINPICVDLDRFDIPENRYHLILNINFLSKRLFPQIVTGLVSGGIFIFETYGAQTAGNGSTMNRGYLVKPNELLQVFQSLKIIYSRESTTLKQGKPMPLVSLVAVKK